MSINTRKINYGAQKNRAATKNEWEWREVAEFKGMLLPRLCLIAALPLIGFHIGFHHLVHPPTQSNCICRFPLYQQLMPKSSLASIWSCRTQGCVRVWMSIRSAIRRRSPPNSEIVTENPSGEPSGNPIWFADSTLDIQRMTCETGRWYKWNPPSKIEFDHKWCNSPGEWHELTKPCKRNSQTRNLGNVWWVKIYGRRLSHCFHTSHDFQSAAPQSPIGFLIVDQHRNENCTFSPRERSTLPSSRRFSFSFDPSKSLTHLSIEIWLVWDWCQLKTGHHQSCWTLVFVKELNCICLRDKSDKSFSQWPVFVFLYLYLYFHLYLYLCRWK